jgi:hypothetical protein
VRSAIVDPRAVIERGRQLAEAGDIQLERHVIDLLVLPDGDDPKSSRPARSRPSGVT